MRLCPEDVSDRLTGFQHNAVTPIGSASPHMPIVLSDRYAVQQPIFCWVFNNIPDRLMGFQHNAMTLMGSASPDMPVVLSDGYQTRSIRITLHLFQAYRADQMLVPLKEGLHLVETCVDRLGNARRLCWMRPEIGQSVCSKRLTTRHHSASAVMHPSMWGVLGLSRSFLEQRGNTPST